MNVDLIVNRQAHGLGPQSGLTEVLTRTAAKLGVTVHETSSLSELERVAGELAARATDVVVLAGGDGSYMAGVSALARSFGSVLPAIGLAPGGTFCTVARNLGMKGAPRSWAERVLRASSTANPSVTEQATLRVRDDAPGVAGDRVGFIFGAGLVAGFFEEYYAAAAQGLLPAARLAARVLAGSWVGSALARRVLAPTPCTLEVDGQKHPMHAFSLVLASVVPDVGLHVRATYRAGQETRRFHLVASGLSARDLGLQVPRVLTGRAMRGAHHVDQLASALRVVFDARRAYVLDGDVLYAKDIRVESGPTLRIVAL